MIRTVRKPAPRPKTLAQQQADFTAEGAPPPAPATAVDALPAASAPAGPPDATRRSGRRPRSGGARRA